MLLCVTQTAHVKRGQKTNKQKERKENDDQHQQYNN